MALTLTELEAERDRLVEVLGKGLRGYEMADGRKIDFSSPDQIRSALAEIERRIKALQGTGPLREVRISSSKGL